MVNLPKVIFITGPTAVGKSDYAFKLAQCMSGEIISCDSMQVYREINVASNKPGLKEMRAIPHHLINVVSVTEEFDVHRFNGLARSAVDDILNRERVPVIVGGSGLYMQVLLDGIFEGEDKDIWLRNDLERLAMDEGNEVLHKKLQEKDPVAAANIHPNNTKRIIRALEVTLREGKPMSILQKKRSGLWGRYDIRVVGLNRKREELYALINQRVDEMFTRGIVEEIEALNGTRLSQTAGAIIGIREIRQFLSGKIDIKKAKEQMKQNTRRFAKRQMTWFRKESRIGWIDIGAQDNFETVLKVIREKAG